MKVLLDCRFVRTGHHDGVSRYTVGLAHALARLHPVELLISDRRQLPHLPDRPWHLARRPTSLAEPWLAHRVNQLRPDVVFSPLQTMGSAGRRYGLVLTLHDLIYHRHRRPPPELGAAVRLAWRLYHLWWWPQRMLLDRADAVVTVSHTSAGLIAAHRLSSRPVVVVPNGAPDTGADVPSAQRTRTLVYMGSFMPYKNVATLARAVSRLPEYELHLMSRIDPRERAQLVALAGDGRLVVHDGTDEVTYRDVLGRATALLSASYDEGFGLPVVEAMSAGTPVILSDIPAFREVAAEAGIHVPPDDVDGFVRAVRALEQPGEWSRRSAAARSRASAFRWEDSARTLLCVLADVAGRRDQAASGLRTLFRSRTRR